MYIIFDKRTGAPLYTIENQVEEIRLEETQGVIESKEKISILDHFVDLDNLVLKEKIIIDIQVQENVLKLISSDKSLKQIKLFIESEKKIDRVDVPLVNGECSIPLTIESNIRTIFSAFDFNVKSNLLIVNDNQSVVNLSTGIII